MPFVYRNQRRTAFDQELANDTPSSSATTLADLWSAGTSTFEDDQSSRTSSLPWANEAIEQNRQEWLQIEEMLYGERELPHNEKIRQELQQWMNRFPHIRVRGKDVRLIEFEPSAHSNISNDEEILAIDPKPFNKIAKPLKLAPSKPANSLLCTNRDHRNVQQPNTKSVSNISSLLERCLQITSSSWSKRPTITPEAERYSHRRLRDDADSAERVKSVRSEIQRFSGFDIDENPEAKSRYSNRKIAATDNRLTSTETPSLGRLRRLPNVPQIDLKSGSSVWQSGRATDRSRITLPPITRHSRQLKELPPSKFQSFRSGRSMSAIHALPSNI